MSCVENMMPFSAGKATTASSPTEWLKDWTKAEKDAMFGKSSFLDLPVELRLTIYEVALHCRSELKFPVLYNDSTHVMEQRSPGVWRPFSPTWLAACSTIFLEGTSILYGKMRWRFQVAASSDGWFDRDVAKLRRSFLTNIARLRLEIYIGEHDAGCHTWLTGHLHKRPQCAFLGSLHNLKRLEIVIERDVQIDVRRTQYPRCNPAAVPNMAGASDLIFWLLQSIPKDVDLKWNTWHPYEMDYLSTRTIKKHAREWDTFRGTSTDIDPSRREPMPRNAAIPEFFIYREAKRTSDKAVRKVEREASKPEREHRKQVKEREKRAAKHAAPDKEQSRKVKMRKV